MDVSQNYETAINYQIRMMPTLILFQGGQAVRQIPAGQVREELGRAVG